MRFSVALIMACALVGDSSRLTGQQAENDRALTKSLTNEVIGVATLPSSNDSAARAILGEAADLQLQFEDLDGYLSTARLIQKMPNSTGSFRSMSRNLVCHLLEERKIPEAKRYASALAAGHTEEDDWVRAHLAQNLLYLPTRPGDSAKTIPVDTVALRRDAIALIQSITTPEVTTDVQIRLAGYRSRTREFESARKALATADSARLLIADEDRRRSRASMIAGQAARLGDWPLAERMLSQLPTWKDLEPLARGSAYSSPDSSQSPELASFNKKVLKRFVDLVNRNPDARVRSHALSQIRFLLEQKKGKALADSLSLPAGPTPRAVEEHGAEANTAPAPGERLFDRVREGRIADAEQLARSIPDPDHLGVGTRLFINALGSAHPRDSAELRRRALAMLLNDRTLNPRDSVLADIARDRLMMWGDNDMAIDIVNEIRDVKLARETLGDMGSSPSTKLDAPGLRKLVDRIRSREVKEQVLYHLMTSMLLVKNAPAAQHAWGLALLDSIRTPDLHSRAKFDVANFLWSRGDSAKARDLFVEVLREDVVAKNYYDRFTLYARLLDSGARDELLAWTRAKPDPIRRGRSLLQVISALRARLPRESNASPGTFIIGGNDACRRDF